MMLVRSLDYIIRGVLIMVSLLYPDPKDIEIVKPFSDLVNEFNKMVS
jgi:hypothetical protein